MYVIAETKTCVNECPFNYYYNVTANIMYCTKKCEDQSNKTATYTNVIEKPDLKYYECESRCITGSYIYRYNQACYTSCPQGTYVFGFECVKLCPF